MEEKQKAESRKLKAEISALLTFFSHF